MAALELMAKRKNASVSAVIEDMVAERMEKPMGAGLVPVVRTAKKR